MRENVDYVNYYPDVDTSIIFCLNGNSRNASEEFEEILAMTRELYGIFQGFYKPVQVGYGIFIYSESIPVYQILGLDHKCEHKVKPLEIIENTVHSEEEVSYQELARNIRSINGASCIKAIRSIGFLKGKTNFTLKSGSEYINSGSQNYHASTEKSIVTEVPRWDPMKIGLSLWPFKTDDGTGYSDLARYELVFETFTDMWFAENEFGRENQRRLKNVLKNVYNRFSIHEVFYYSDHYDEDWLTDIIPKVSL